MDGFFIACTFKRKYIGMNVSHTSVSVASMYGMTCSICPGCSHQNQKNPNVTDQQASPSLQIHCWVADSTGTRKGGFSAALPGAAPRPRFGMVLPLMIPTSAETLIPVPPPPQRQPNDG
ncbi:hypothetical protein [Mesorhizobium sp.]|uniref:hypothetical protein n=1 Tax=Mesorhizobium sp. TaxID=1871066 RepID=UPI0025F6B4E6|nr:hypothetical protein [Mesorhizobium sp.]